LTHHPCRPCPRRAGTGSVRPVTWLWALLIVIGLAMVLVAVWPSIRGGKKGDSEAD